MAQQGGVSGVKLLIMALALGFSVYILGPPLYWHFVGDAAGKHLTSCPLCICDCPNDGLNNIALADLANVTLPDCARDDPDMQDELGKSRYQLLQEELKLQEIVAEEAQQRSEAAFLEAKKVASQYQKEFEKCNQGMETSEGAREKAEAALTLEKKRSEVWESRARSLGWKDDNEGTIDTENTENQENHENSENTENNETADTTDHTENNENTEHTESNETTDGGGSVDVKPDAKKLKADFTEDTSSRSTALLNKSRRDLSSKQSSS
ncbi:hypothetical protein Mapa_004026 [Marchantia paleacea]|nr:hypothetical protein Mapa_004026 [Marchantia paleacea]